jgi:alpha-amylase
MRMATLAELIAAEDLAAGNAAVSGVADYDLDGIDEVLIGTAGQTVLVDTAEGAGIGSWDLRATRVALASVMRRRPEAYHARIKSNDLGRLLVYDNHERRSGLVRILDRRDREVGDFVNGEWHLEAAQENAAAFVREAESLSVRKTVFLEGGRQEGALGVSVEVDNVGSVGFEGALELEWNINLMGGGGNEKAFYRTADFDARHDSDGSVAAGEELTFGNEAEGAEIRVGPEPATAQSWYSVETVSNSESGFERTHQGSCLIQRWTLRLAPGESRRIATIMKVTQSRDRATE